MRKKTYVTPIVTSVGDFREVTNGLWFGRWRDIYGGRAFIKISIG